MSDVATKLVEKWATDRLTKPTPPERDLAQWIGEQIHEDPELAMAKAALDSWWGRVRAIEAVLEPVAGDQR